MRCLVYILRRRKKKYKLNILLYIKAIQEIEYNRVVTFIITIFIISSGPIY